MISSPPPPLHPGRRFNSATVPMHLSQIGDLSHRQTRQFRREMSQKHCTFLSIEIAEATPGFHNWTDVTGIWAFPSRCPCGGLNHPFLFLINLVMWPKYLIYQSLHFFFFLLNLWRDDCGKKNIFFAVGEGNGNPLQCSCLENPKDEAAVYGAAQSWKRLKQLSSSSSGSFSGED